VDEKQMVEIKSWREHCFEKIFVINVGNMQFKNPPSTHTRYGTRSDFLKRRMIYESLDSKNRGIVFCGSRAQVFYWSDWFRRRGINCLACVGGQVENFRQGLALSPNV